MSSSNSGIVTTHRRLCVQWRPKSRAGLRRPFDAASSGARPSRCAGSSPTSRNRHFAALSSKLHSRSASPEAIDGRADRITASLRRLEHESLSAASDAAIDVGDRSGSGPRRVAGPLLSRARRTRARAFAMCLLTLVYVRPPVSSAISTVAEAGDQEGEVGALAIRQTREDAQRLARLEDGVDRERRRR